MARIVPVALSTIPNSQTADVRYLYVIGEAADEALNKIGKAANPVWRRAELQAGNSRKLVLRAAWEVNGRDLAHRFERGIHSILGQHWVFGEWFRVTVDDVDRAVAEFIASGVGGV